MAVSWATWSATSTNTGDSWNVSTFCTAPTPLPATGSTRIALNLRGTAAIAGGQNFSLALASDGTAWAWGYNGYGQLRNGTTTDSITPVRVQRLGGRTITAIAAGAYYSLAFASDGTVWAWGDNSTGQLGNGTTTNSSVPVQVQGLLLAVNIKATGVVVGGRAATDIVMAACSIPTVLFTMPAGSVGVVDVVVTTQTGSGGAGPTLTYRGAFTYD